MKIRKINYQSFGNKNLRLPIENIAYTIEGRTLWSKKTFLVREYSNPKTKELYEKAQNTRNIKEMTKLYDEMGHYEIKEMNFLERMRSFFHK